MFSLLVGFTWKKYEKIQLIKPDPLPQDNISSLMQPSHGVADVDAPAAIGHARQNQHHGAGTAVTAVALALPPVQGDGAAVLQLEDLLLRGFEALRNGNAWNSLTAVRQKLGLQTTVPMIINPAGILWFTWWKRKRSSLFISQAFIKCLLFTFKSVQIDQKKSLNPKIWCFMMFFPMAFLPFFGCQKTAIFAQNVRRLSRPPPQWRRSNPGGASGGHSSGAARRLRRNGGSCCCFKRFLVGFASRYPKKNDAMII